MLVQVRTGNAAKASIHARVCLADSPFTVQLARKEKSR